MFAQIISQVTPSESSVIKKVAYEPLFLAHLKQSLGVKGIRRVAMHERLTNLRPVIFLQFAANTPRTEVWRGLHGASTLQSNCGKIVIAVSEDIDPTSMDAVLWSLAYRTNPAEDMHIVRHRGGVQGAQYGPAARPTPGCWSTRRASGRCRRSRCRRASSWSTPASSGRSWSCRRSTCRRPGTATRWRTGPTPGSNTRSAPWRAIGKQTGKETLLRQRNGQDAGSAGAARLQHGRRLRLMVSDRAAYRGDVDGLRAVAVLLVIGFHFFPRYVPGGFIGVDVFFVISGFLITRLIVVGLEDGSFTLADFYARRIRRIFPALALVLAVSLVAGWLLLFPLDYRDLGKHAAAAAVFIANFTFLNEAGYFDTSSELKPLLHLWSLGVEEQFYIVWPVLMLLAWRWRYSPFLIAAGLLVASFAWNVWLTGSNQLAAFYLPFTRFWELMLGGILAIASLVAADRGGPSARIREALSLSGLALLAAAVVLISRERAFPGWWAALPTIGTALHDLRRTAGFPEPPGSQLSPARLRRAHQLPALSLALADPDVRAACPVQGADQPDQGGVHCLGVRAGAPDVSVH